MLTFLQLPSFPEINDTHPILLNIWDSLDSLYRHIQSLPTNKKEEVLEFFKTNSCFPDSSDLFRQVNHDFLQIYSTDTMPVINFNHRQFNIPLKLCWSDLMSLCINAFKPTSNTDLSSFNIDSVTKTILKNKIAQLVNKVLRHTKDNDQLKFVPQPMRAGFDV